MSSHFTRAANAYNRSRKYARWVWEDIQRVVGASPVDGIPGPKTARTVAAWQKANDLKPDGKVGPTTLDALAGPAGWTEARELSEEHIACIIYGTTIKESGGSSAAMNLDIEFEGWADRPTKTPRGKYIAPEHRPRRHWASKYKEGSNGYHIGLSAGRAQWAQHAGSLGTAAAMIRDLDPENFNRIMGEHADEMMEMLTAPWDFETWEMLPDGNRNPRVQKIDGADMWEEPWLSRWRELSRLDAWAEVELSLAYRGYLKPLLPLLKKHGLTSAQHLAVWFDVANANGASGARSRLRKALRETSARDPKSLIDTVFESRDARQRRYDILKGIPPQLQYTW